MSTTKQDILTLQAVPQCTGIRESQSRLIHHHKFCKSTAKCVEDMNMYTRHSLVPRPNFMCTSCAWAMERWGLHSLVPRPPLFFVLQFAFSIIHKSKRAVKNGEGLGTHNT